MRMTSITFAAALFLVGLAVTSVQDDEVPKPIKVLLIGNSQCPTIVGQQLLEKLAASETSPSNENSRSRPRLRLSRFIAHPASKLSSPSSPHPGFCWCSVA